MVHTQRVGEADVSGVVRFVFVDDAVAVHIRLRPVGPWLNDGKVIHGVRAVRELLAEGEVVGDAVYGADEFQALNHDPGATL